MSDEQSFRPGAVVFGAAATGPRLAAAAARAAAAASSAETAASHAEAAASRADAVTPKPGADGAPMRVVCGVIWRGGCFLASRRPAGYPYAGWWEFPGGKIERGETDAQALARELREELGIVIADATSLTRVRHDYPERMVDLHFFMVNSFEGEPAAAEHQTLRWLSFADALALPFLPPDMPVLKALAEGYAREGVPCIL